ncbi:LOW QUALITY PROTEIN: hypothetical protein T265_15626 [Opisthorchis viverrini]|uniref:Uncharacterized protein n=1 Tax=Opisthorchis viverrini TaxID=6198 RepID=A0A074ZVL4_OPIVI|nr:LOW QUALITY PROTEIN: hypothetical protein T265_15626 [Opisthorchis viverrini]KER19184.1 LOW QUALITY PROTEIN: hypothetical protein T265_15626 [Opisthorchis viverrini]
MDSISTHRFRLTPGVPILCDFNNSRLLLKIRRQPTTGFALFGSLQAQSPGFRQTYVLPETKLHEISEYTLICLRTSQTRESAGFQWDPSCDRCVRHCDRNSFVNSRYEPVCSHSVRPAPLRRRQLLQCFYRPSNDQSSTDRPTNRVTQTLSEDATLVDIKGDHPLDPQTEVTLSRLTVPGAEGVSLKGSRHDGPLQFRPDPNKKSFAKQLSVVPSIIHPSQTTTDVQVHPRPPRGMEVSFSIGGGDSVLSRASTPNERNSQGTLNEDV